MISVIVRADLCRFGVIWVVRLRSGTQICRTRFPRLDIPQQYSYEEFVLQRCIEPVKGLVIYSVQHRIQMDGFVRELHGLFLIDVCMRIIIDNRLL